jgi:endonuclease V-like protein UPF0215 family
MVKLSTVKPEIRIIGIDDSPFDKFHGSKRVLVIGAVFRAGKWLEGVVSTHIVKDGTDATKKLIRLVNQSRHKGQLRIIMLNGIALGGFNVIDIQELCRKTSLPVIIIMRRKPDYNAIENALKHFKDGKRRLEIILKAGAVKSVLIKGKKIYFQHAGITENLCEKIIKLSATHSLVPEPIRAAHIIGSGIVLGETRGRV